MSQRADGPSQQWMPQRSCRRPVVRVVDGDTLELDQGERVRLIGIDCPELSEPLGPRAAEWVRTRVEGRLIRLSFDPATILTDHRDVYGRTLAYVWLTNNRLLNRELVRAGYATVDCGYPCVLTKQLIAIERHARRQQLGLWHNPHRCMQRALARESDRRLAPLRPYLG